MIDPRPLASDDRIDQLSPEQLDLLLRRFQGQVVEEPDGIRPRQRSSEGAPLSFAQERLWFLDQLRPGSSAYNVPVAFRLCGPLDQDALAASLDGLVRRHEILRTTFVAAEGNPIQFVSLAAECTLPFTDLSTLAPAERDRELARFRAEEASRPFDLALGPLLRAALLRLAAQEHVLLLTLHHIVADATSLGLILREITALYQGTEPPELPVQYADYAVWQREWLQGERLAAQLAYWRHQLAGAPMTLELPADRPRPPVQSFRGASRRLGLPDGAAARLRQTALREGVTPYMLLLAGFAALLARCTGQEDLLIGTPVDIRTRPEVERLIGFFVNT
ncbi:MAG TPA: condensation domain-containing protein, partial [Thermoanaerobaculia bacterium]|nr:condensation domain-containing protein [Thermoanaerobaculia bacterium]